MAFSHDAFISYAHIDNQPLPTEKEGWITIFEKALRQLLSRYMGKEARVWRDQKLHGNDIFSDEILTQFSDTAVLVSILSPRYLKSEWCGKEMVKFLEAAEKTGGVVIGNKARIFKVIKTPIGKDEALPPPVSALLAHMLGYEFYHVDDDNTPRELDPAFGDPARQEFLKRVTTVAWHIKELLEDLQTRVPAAAVQKKTAVYLADCTRDRRDARQQIETELKRLGYEVLPNRELPLDELEYVAEVTRLLSRSSLSVHLVGKSYGAVPDGPTEKSVAMLQNEIAVRVSKERTLPRVISIPADVTSTDQRQTAFINALHTDADMQFGADVLTGGIEELKSAIRTALDAIAGMQGKGDTAAMEKSVFVVCSPRDQKDTVPLVRGLIARGAHVELTVFAGDPAQVREANQELMMRADAIVLFYGAGDETWKFYQESEIKKIRGARRDKPPVTWTYVGAPTSERKQFVIETEKNVIDAVNGFSRNLLDPVAKTLKLQ